jgi:hypothetical protein
VRLRGATPPHRQLLLVHERPRELTEPNRASRHPDHPPTTTVASTPLRTGARASRSSALRPVKRWPDSRLRGRRLLGLHRCPRASRVRDFVLVVVTVRAVVGSASGFRTASAGTPKASQRSASRYRPPAGTPDRLKAPQSPASQYHVSPVRPAHSPHLRGRSRAVHRSSASRVSLNPPRSHSVAPNPGMQRTRCARR